MKDFNVLQRLLTELAKKHGDGVEVSSRRGTEMVGISLFSITDQYPSPKNEWIEDLDGLLIEQAYLRALAVAYDDAEKEERSQNEK